MHRSSISLFVVPLFLCTIALRASAQTVQQRDSSVIGEIHATGSRLYTESQVIAESGLKRGDVVTRQQIQGVADRLAHLGVFEFVNFKFVNHGNTITLEFELKDAPAFPVVFDNFPWLRDDEIVGSVREAIPLFAGTAPQDGSQLTEMTGAITKLLKARGIAASVQHKLVAAPPSYNGLPNLPPRAYTSVLPPDDDPHNRSTDQDKVTGASFSEPMVMQFYLEGPAVTIGSLDYGDVVAENSEKLRDRNSDLLGKPFSRFAIQVFENEQVLPLYLAAGRLRVKLGEPVVHFADAANPPAPAPSSANGSNIAVTLPIEPGPVFHLANVAWSGNGALNDADLAAQLVVAHGELADGMRLAAGWQRIENAYAHRGYLDVHVDPKPQFDDAGGGVSYNVAITEGSQYHMGELVVTGLSLTAERVLRAVWRQAPGDVFDGIYFDDMLMQIQKPTPAIFGGLPLHYSEVGHWLRPNPETHTVDVLLDFK